METHNIRTIALRSPARGVRYVFSRLNIQRYSPDKGEGTVFANIFLRKGVRTDQRWAAGIGASGGQPGSTANARRSLAVVQTYEIRVSMGVRLGATQDGRGSQPEERHGLAADVHMIDRRRKTRYGGFRINNFRTHNLLRSGDSISEFDRPLPQSVPNYRRAA
jgi:hypothetical protein